MSCNLHQQARDWLRRAAPGYYSPDLGDADVERATLRAAQALYSLLLTLREFVDEVSDDLGLAVPLRVFEEGEENVL